MKETVIQKIIADIKECQNRKVEFTTEGFILLLQNSLKDESEQIKEAYHDGRLRKYKFNSSDYYDMIYGNLETYFKSK